MIEPTQRLFEDRPADVEGLHVGAAAAADGVIHLAFMHDFSDFAGAAAADLRAVEAIGAALDGSDKPFVVTSVTLLLAILGRLVTEEDVSNSARPRVASEIAAIALVERGVRSAVVRLPPLVHGDGDKHAFVPRLTGFARKSGVSGYVGDGHNRWLAVHRLDAARLFRLALEKGEAGARYHAVAEEGVPFRDSAEAIGRSSACRPPPSRHKTLITSETWPPSSRSTIRRRAR